MTIANRKFGIEIECIGANKQHVVTALNEIGVRCDDLTGNSYSTYHATHPSWKIVLDGSVHGGWEIVSPILVGEEGIEQVRKVAKTLVAKNATVNKNCGLHVHVDAHGLSIKSIVNVARRYAKFETEINNFMPVARRSNQYCRAINASDLDYIESRGISYLGGLDRYQKVNLSAYARHGTVEFRQHSGTVNGEKMENWIRFCVAFVEASIINEPAVAEVNSSATPSAPVAELNVMDLNIMDCAEMLLRAEEPGIQNPRESSIINNCRDWINRTIQRGWDYSTLLQQSRYDSCRTAVTSFIESERARIAAERAVSVTTPAPVPAF